MINRIYSYTSICSTAYTDQHVSKVTMKHCPLSNQIINPELLHFKHARTVTILSTFVKHIDNITWCFQYPPWYLAEVPSICPMAKWFQLGI